MAFLTDLGVYFYKVMSFGLKNAGATYQRAVNKMFAQQIGWNVEVYVDDMIVKSHAAADHLTDLTETFVTLRSYGRLLKWSVELREFDIHYALRTAIKAQSVADFISELVQTEDQVPGQPGEAWILHVDGSSTSSGAGAGLVLSAPDGRSFERSLRFGFHATNNEAEYEALLIGLRLSREMQVDAIHVLTNSQLLAEQLSGGYAAREPTMAKYLAEVKSLAFNFSHFTVSRVPRCQNERADELARLASKSESRAHPEIERLPSRAISVSAVSTADARTTWVQEMLRFKRDEILSADEASARRIRRTQAWHSEVNERLYKRSFSHPLLRCLGPEEAQMVLAEVHEGICGEHIVGRTLAYKILRQGYYWPTMRHPQTPRQPAVPLAPIHYAWPFAQWGLDLLGPFHPASGQRKYIVVGVDYFTRWLEAKPLATIAERQVEKFVWRNIVTQFGLPRTIVTDNESKFASTRFREFCVNYVIQLRFSPVAHPQTNGLAEVTNRSILDGLR
ncbi:uncharacterized protein LOC135611400 [Musa acuminata AAA Group]|uniref:uncharacterized protein LOC135611400 n=1 Tax=Musa acuminata AAA Group TaxID=214697 RepID=UPI0031E478B1